MWRIPSTILLIFAVAGPVYGQPAAPTLPLPEHPRPDLRRELWMNLNGTWDFRFDAQDRGLVEGWQDNPGAIEGEIVVPFPWGSPLSGVADDADIGWYGRSIRVPEAWRGHRIFLVVGASDWTTTAWLDGELLGSHSGGYTPFEFELSGHLRPGAEQRLVMRVDDSAHDFKLEGKQGYGPARGIWQTVYLEARGAHPAGAVQLRPEEDLEGVRAMLELLEPADRPLRVTLAFPNGEREPVTGVIAPGRTEFELRVPLPGAHRWSLDDPYLHDVEVRVSADGGADDVVRTYFGMRSVSVADLPGTDIPYVALNGEPVYLQLALDQAYHPDGFYAFPTDDAIRLDVLRARSIGLNGIRVHVKVGLPRKLYWADRLGVLVMADVPNSWGEPGPEMRSETEHALRQMIRRDYNHPSVFAWVLFNETWGLRTRTGEEGGSIYSQETKDWVTGLVEEVRRMDPSRLVEDNSVCCGVGHTVTDLNSWHAYEPGWVWPQLLDTISDSTYDGSSWNYEPGYRHAGHEPNINSEFGNVWGYRGSTGDVDWSWDYHRAVDAFRMHPRIAGWLYTEHHDVVNEWNGYWRYDRSEKQTGLGTLAPGMTLADLQSPLYVVVGDPAALSRSAEPGERVRVPLWLSSYEPTGLGEAVLEWRLHGWDHLGRHGEYGSGSRGESVDAWAQRPLEPLDVRMPDGPAVAVLTVTLRDGAGVPRHRNFTTFVVDGNPEAEGAGSVLLVRPPGSATGEWSERSWTVLDGLKVDGAGYGWFEYRFPWPDGLDPSQVRGARFVVEASAKEYFDKDRPEGDTVGGDFMRGGGSHSPHRNPNAYPMTDATVYPSVVRVDVNGEFSGRFDLPDDPADHRGVLSWHAQPTDRTLHEAGSYGYLVEAPIGNEAIGRAAASGAFVVRLSVEEAVAAGLAIYGRSFGRYPVDPTVVIILNE